MSDEILKERGERYGEFFGHAAITQQLKESMYDSPNWKGLYYDQREALEMIVHKIGRILNGDPNYADSWTDIIGYARLVEKRLLNETAIQTKLLKLCDQCKISVGRMGDICCDCLHLNNIKWP